jgi:PRD1 phage membrane DNA delivery
VSDKNITGLIQILLALTGVSIVAVLVSKQSDTSNILTKGGSSFGCAVSTALSPITGSSGCNTSVMSTIAFPTE